VRIFKSEVRPGPQARPMMDVRVATARDFTRLEMHWARPAGMSIQRKGARSSSPSTVRPSPTWRGCASIRRSTSKPRSPQGPRGLQLVLLLAEGSDARVGVADGVAYVNLFKVGAPDTGPAAPRKSGVPANGVVPVAAVPGAASALRFAFTAPVGAAVFRRGEALWMVFDADAALDLSRVPRTGRWAGMTTVRGPGFTALRLVAPADMDAEASALNGVWTVSVGPEKPRPEAVSVTAERADGPMALSAAMAGVTGVRWIEDPVVGDRIAVVTALAPAKGVPVRRAFVETTLLPSAHGLAIEPRTDDLVVQADADVVRIYRPQGLALSGGAARVAAPAHLPARAAMPGVIDPRWAELKDQSFLDRQSQLLAAAAAEAAQGDTAPTAARLGLARFLIASELVHEGQGVLTQLRRKSPAVLNDPDFRGLQGAARVLIGRSKEAEADFASPVLAGDPASALWRGLLASEDGDHARALAQLSQGAPALHLYSPRLRARFAEAQAESALAMGDVKRAALAVNGAGTGLVGADALDFSLVRAKVTEAAGDSAGALKIYEIVARTSRGATGAEAELRATRLKHALGQLNAPAAAKIYHALRWRWRGDDTELETLRTLGALYLAAGRHREALNVLHSAGPRLSSPTGVAIQNEMTAVFRRLFLDGGADGMQPVQALALFYDFRDLTPVGADGDLMTRRLAQRLIAVDLLPQAAELLKHQSEQRLDGVARAQVATGPGAGSSDGPQSRTGAGRHRPLAHHHPAHRAQSGAPPDRGARADRARPARPRAGDHRLRRLARRPGAARGDLLGPGELARGRRGARALPGRRRSRAPLRRRRVAPAQGCGRLQPGRRRRGAGAPAQPLQRPRPHRPPAGVAAHRARGPERRWAEREGSHARGVRERRLCGLGGRNEEALPDASGRCAGAARAGGSGASGPSRGGGPAAGHALGGLRPRHFSPRRPAMAAPRSPSSISPLFDAPAGEVEL
jgi:hypothetical protein